MKTRLLRCARNDILNMFGAVIARSDSDAVIFSSDYALLLASTISDYSAIKMKLLKIARRGGIRLPDRDTGDIEVVVVDLFHHRVVYPFSQVLG